MELAPVRPSVGFGQVRHTRLRPRLSRFIYRAFFLRLPLRALERGPWPTRLLRHNRAGLTSIHDADHGEGRPLLAWITELLTREGIRDANGEIWLHTFPRVLGYLFNPVSFWFAERSDGRLRAVLCEVNNTFGERHCYLLAHDDGRPIAWGEEMRARKVFHVSPFCPVEGSYRFRFMLSGGDATHPPRFVGRIDYDDREGPLLETSLGGALHTLSTRTMLWALLGYPAFTLGVMLRIHWQALKLALGRVPMFSKPEPPTLDVTR
jgi:hypothetical protein